MIEKSNLLANRLKTYIEGSVPFKTSNGYTVDIENIGINIPEENFDHEKHLQMRYTGEGKTEGYISGTINIKNMAGNSIHKGHYAKLITFPVATDRGSYIINGIEKNIVSQMRMKSGVYTGFDGKKTKTQLRFNNDVRGGTFIPAMTLVLESGNKAFHIDITSYGKTHKFNIVNFLSLLGFSDLEIQKSFGDNAYADDILKTNLKKRNEKSIEALYKVFFPRTEKGEVLTDKIRRERILDLFSNKARFGDGSVVKATLNTSSVSLTKEVILKSVKKTVSVASGLVDNDVKDEMKFKEIYNDTDLIFDALRNGFDKFVNNTTSRLEDMDSTDNKAGILSNMSATIHEGLNGKDGLINSDLCVASEQINPLFMEAKSREITQNGPGGMSKDSGRNETDARNLTSSGINKIDPIETPESGKIGITQHLTVGAVIEDKTVKTELLKVVNGEAIDDESNKVRLDSLQEEEHVIAFNDSRYVEYVDGVYKFKEDVVPVRYLGKNEKMPVSKVKFIDSKPQSVLGTSANLIPFVSFDDGARALMGAAMQKQAINLVNREVPLVTTLEDKKTGLTFEEKVGNSMCKPVKSLSDGTVSKITNSKIIVKNEKGEEFTHSYYNYFPLNQNYINNELKVKVGDKVTQGQILAEGWQTKDGNMALGTNARIGFIPYKGYNYEDGVVVSESFAEKMKSDEYDEVEIFIPKTAKGGRGSKIKQEILQETTNACVRNFDSDGIIKQGERIKSGSVLVGYFKEINKESTDLIDLISLGGEKVSYKYSEISVPAGSYVSGEIVRITVINNPDALHKQKIIFSVTEKKKLKIGDKIAGRHGNKGTITKILPDELMPVAADGKALDIMMSPLAVPSRKNLGQILEVGAGLIAEKTGEKFIVDNFNHKEKERVLSKLEEIGYKDGKMEIKLKERDENGNIIDVPAENAVTVGNMYIMKLKHKVDDKIQSRSNRETPLTSKTYMPMKLVGTAQGEKSNPQRLGEMEMRVLQAHGAAFNILENTTIKADGAGDSKGKAAIFKAIATGKLDSADLDKNVRPETLKVMSDSLKVLGLDVKPLWNGVESSLDKPFNALGLSPLNQDEFLKTIGIDKEVSKSDMLQARQFFRDEEDNDDNKVSAEAKGGLLDTEIFGDEKDPESRNKWGYIKLPMPVPNPVFMEDASHNIYESLTGLNKNELKTLTGIEDKSKKPTAIITDISEMEEMFSKIQNPQLVKEYKKQIVENMAANGFKPGDLVSLDALDKLKKDGINIPYKTGGDALEFLLNRVDISKGLETAKQELDDATDADKINKAFKKVRAFEMLEKNNIKPKDLLVKVVPVAPTYLRPVIADKADKSVFVNDLNKLYGKIILAKKISERDAVLNEDGRLEQMGLAPNDLGQRSKMLYNSLKTLHGNLEATDNGKSLKSVEKTLGGKHGLVRKEMLGKRVDFSGRSVITVNPNLKLNEIGMPMDMAKQLFKPFAIRELVRSGVCKDESKAEDMIKKTTPEVKEVLQRIANEKPIMLNRQPSLHKHSMQSFKAVIKDYEDGGAVRSIQLNPLVVTGFNADFDGDTMSAHVAVSEKANDELKKLTMPYQNLISPGDGKMIIEIRHEMALGIYQLTKHWQNPKGKLVQYNNNKDMFRDYTLGRIASYQRVRVPICPDETTVGQALFNWTIPEKIKKYRNFRTAWNKNKISKMMMDIYTESEKTGFKMFSKMEISDLFDEIKDLGFKASTRSTVSIGTADFEMNEEAKEKINKIIESNTKNGVSIDSWNKVQEQIESSLKKGLLSENNALQIMMDSGSRANAQQIRKMISNIGIGMDVSKNLLAPIQSSHYDGLSPQEYYTLGNDSRKGLYDRSVSTAKPGKLSRDIWAATQDMVISEKDCKITEFIYLNKKDKTIKGRIAGKSVLDQNGKIICKKGQMISTDIYNKIYADDTVELVPVRSVLRCKTRNGKCQLCYGANAGTTELVKIGTAVGVIASQAVGEPVTQMTMNTFHTGGANSAATLGLPRISSILSLSNKPDSKALLAEVSGIVTDIIDTPASLTVTVGKKKHIYKKININDNPTVKVKKGDIVKKGDFLTAGDISDISIMTNEEKGVTQLTLTNADPKRLFKLKSESEGQKNALNYTQDYLVNSMQYAIGASGAYMDRRHSEAIISKLTGTAMVTDSGDSPYMKGQKADVNLFEKWNRDNCTGTKTKKISPSSLPPNKLMGYTLANDVNINGKSILRKGQIIDNTNINLVSRLSSIVVALKPIVYTMEMQGQLAASVNQDNWFSNLASSRGIGNAISSGAAMGSVDNLQDPRSRVMAGKLNNIGDVATLTNEFKDKYGNKMSNFFNNKINIKNFKK